MKRDDDFFGGTWAGHSPGPTVTIRHAHWCWCGCKREVQRGQLVATKECHERVISRATKGS